jgi:hypothetical protein
MLMSKSFALATVIVSSAVFAGLFARVPSAQAKDTCESKLVDKSYQCSFTDNDSAPFDECFHFFTGGSSQYFDLDNGADYGCGCDAKGADSFNSSANTFECSDNLGAFMFVGKINGKKLSVQGVGSDGEQYVGTCVIRSTPCI